MPTREYLDQSNVLVGDGRAKINFISLQHTSTLASGLLIIRQALGAGHGGRRLCLPQALGDHVSQQVDHAVGIAPLVVVPAH